MPRAYGTSTVHAGLYEWIGAGLEASRALPDPRLPEGTRGQHVPERLARFRQGLPMEVPAWRLDGNNARAAGFRDVVPHNRSVRAPAYVVRPDDSVAPVGSGFIA